MNVGTRGLRISPQHGLEDVAAVLVIYANLPNLPSKCQKKLALAIDLGKGLSISRGCPTDSPSRQCRNHKAAVFTVWLDVRLVDAGLGFKNHSLGSYIMERPRHLIKHVVSEL